ncbi:hypothetical protein [Paractinoplanes maris]|uniref:hypothetical protein n=1 Tax=Paractinoplanes maris TaxID=1734446 RepID=UPI0020203A38|nr:hypothetical protein [Actinoplanes maris]
MITLPFALGCPSCPHHVVLPEADQGAGIDRMCAHLDREHRRDGAPNALLARTRKLTKEEVA